ncbi:MAG TPA: 4Fe-4S dicluster domain-containing protein [Armatimonadetes bacterium]|nr:4Fe-4S dicluster domain-containing protein [Armatimonadota bacterium]
MKQTLKVWTELPEAGIIDRSGTAREYKTGGWRTHWPLWDAEKCVHCLLCWVYCPEGAVQVEEGKVVGMDLDYCKGCGICAQECPPKVKAITMQWEEM